MTARPTDLMSLTVSEAELVQKAAQRDKRAFKILFRRYRDPIFAAVFRKMRIKEDAEDIVQETFLRAYEKLSTLKNPQAFPAWLYRVAAQMCVDHVRRKIRLKRLYSKLYEEEPLPGDDPRHPAGQQEIMQRMMAAIRMLDSSSRLLISLVYLQGWNSRQISEKYGESETSVRVRLHRTLKALRLKLRRYIASTASIPIAPQPPQDD